MKVLFLHLGRESLGIEYLSSSLKAAGHETALGLDPGLFGENDNVFYVPKLERFFDQSERLLRLSRRIKPDAVAFSAYTSTYRWCLQMARDVKRDTQARVVMGGPHATLVPDAVAARPEVDFAVAGEGEEAMAELANALEAGRAAHGIANIALKHNGRVRVNPVRPPIADLDALPLPDKALFEKDINFEDDYLVLGSRGCVYHCTYCCESFLNDLYCRQFYRRRSVASVMDELLLMKQRYRYKEVMFNDAVLCIDKQWLADLMARFRAEIGVPFRCFGQARHVNEETARLLKSGGCYAIEFGVQTVNEDIRRRILNRRETNETNARAFAACDAAGIAYDLDHMFGLPEETVADHKAAATFYSGLKRLNRVKVHNLTCFPRTAMADIMREKDLLSDEDLHRMEAGETGDFFHVDEIRDPQAAQAKRAFANLFKLLPGLPGRWTRRFAAGEGWRWFGRMPKPLVICGQTLIALRHLDYRFWLYIRYYMRRIQRWARTHASAK